MSVCPRTAWRLVSCVPVVLACLATAGAQQAGHLGLPVDWSFRHVAGNSGDQRDPRAIYNALRAARGQTQDSIAPINTPHRGGDPRKAKIVHSDWHVTLGNGTMVAANAASSADATPAKFSFDINATPDCSNDYVVYVLQVAGSSSQPNVIAFNNLYSGTTGSEQNVVAYTEAGTTATVTTQAAHGFTVGQTVIIDGAPVNGYNGTFVITSTTSTTFSYVTTAGLAALANGGGTATLATAIAPLGASESGSTVTITTSTAHGLSVGNYVTIQGVTPAGYNGTHQIATVPSTTSFTYTSATTGLAAGGSGSATGSGMCGLGPTVKFAYNISTNADIMTTSPVISLDGTKVAFIGTTGNSGGQAFLYILTLPTTGSNGSWDATNNQYIAAVPGTGNNASVLSYEYTTNAQNLYGSSPYVDYYSDVAYFGDDKGSIYKSTCVFLCAQNSITLGTATGYPVALGGIKQLASPVVDINTGKLFVGSTDGKLYSCTVSNCSGTKTSIAVGNGAANGGVVDSVLLDSTFGTVFVNSGQNAGNNHTIVQLDESLNTLATIANGNQAFPVPSGALSDEYFNNSVGATSATGFAYFCGPVGGSGQADIYTVGFTQPVRTIAASTAGAREVGSTVTITTSAAHGFSVGDTVVIAGVAVAGYNGTFTIVTVPSSTTFTYTDATTGLANSGGGTATQQQLTATNPPTLNTATFTVTAIAGPNKATCSPFTILTNAGTERLFFSQPKAPCPTGPSPDGCMFSYSINTGTGVVTQVASSSQHGGTSGPVIDNVSTVSQASSLYFATEAKTNPNASSAASCTYGTGGAAAFCAVKLTQSGLN